MPPSVKRAVLFGAGLAVFLFVSYSLWARWRWEQDKTVEICVDGAEIESLTNQDDGDTWRMLETLRTSGVSSVAVYWDPARPLSDLMSEWAPRIPDGLSVTLRPEPVPFSDCPKVWPAAALLPKKGPPIRNVLFPGETVMGFPDLSMVKEWLAKTDVHLPWIEFSRQRGMADLQRAFPQRIVRAHTLTEEEMPLATPPAVVGRLRRAVRERGARFLYVRLFPGLPRAQNEEFVARLTKALQSDGWKWGGAAGRYGEWPAPLFPLADGVRRLLAFVVSVGVPLWAFHRALRFRSAYGSAVAMAGAGLAAGGLVAALLSTPSFALGFHVFRGVKLALLLPLGAALFSLYRADEIRHILQEPVTVGRLVLGALVLGGVSYFVLRIGHGTVADASGMELAVRGGLENLLGVRPRFKEFLIGHPFLWLGFYLRRRQQAGGLILPQGKGAAAQALHFLFHDPRPFLLVGFIGPLSMVNTFCHAHTPLWVSLVRVCHGAWIGAGLGMFFISVLKRSEGRWQRLP